MIKQFEEGEVYRNKKLDKDIMVYGIASETDSQIIMAVGFVDRESEEMTSPGEITVNKTDLIDWEVVQ